MDSSTVAFEVRRPADGVSVVDIRGEVTPAAEDALESAFSDASSGTTRAVVLNFAGLEYMNSGGIGLLVTLLVRAQRQHQQLCAYGLSDHYRQILQLTRLDEAIGIFDDEAAALEAAS